MGAAATFVLGDSLFGGGKATSALTSMVGGGKSSAAPAAPTAIDPHADENEAQKAAERRRRLYAAVGRSSTILTGPGGLGTIGQQTTTPKQLLGL